MLQFLDTTAAASAGGGMASTLVMLVLMIGIFYFMLIRPENKRKKEAEQMRSALKVGDEITTIGGITGTVVSVKDDKFVIETGADQVRIEFAKWALSTNDSAAAAAKEEAKKAQEAKAKQKVTQVKEVKFRPATDENDFQTKIRAVRRFLEGGDKAKITLRYRGREMAHQEFGVELMDRVKTELGDIAQVEQNPKLEGRQMIMVLGPKRKK